MEIINSFELLFENLLQLYNEDNSKQCVIIIAGLSRSGKSTLTNELTKCFSEYSINISVVRLDSWLIDVDKRKEGSTVAERYDIDEINNAINDLLKGKSIYPPIYNQITRKRIEGEFDKPINFTNGILIIEGVIALSNSKIREKGTRSIYVDIDNLLRLKRLIFFYKNVKNLSKVNYKKIIFDRETEETPFIKKTYDLAQIIFKWPVDNNIQIT